MASLISGEQEAHFKYLSDVATDSLIHICKLSLDNLRDGPKPDKYAAICDKFGLTADALGSTIESMVYLLVECIRLQLPDLSSLSSHGFTEEKIGILWEFVQKEEAVVRSLLSADHNRLHFRDLEWRVESRIASRALHRQATPLITMKLHLDTQTINENKEMLNTDQEMCSQEQILMQMDPSSLRGIIESLDQAIQESKSHRTRLFVRAFEK